MANLLSTNSRSRRVGVGVGVLALALGASALGSGVASAGTETANEYTFTRTVDNANPEIGDVITFTTLSETTSPVGAIESFTENFDECLKFVPGSARVTKLHIPGGMTTTVETPELTPTKLKVSGNGWLNTNGRDVTMTTSYTVSSDCTPGAVLRSSLGVRALGLAWWGGSDNANFPNIGPSVTVKVPDPVDPGTGSGTGSLGSATGSLGSMDGGTGSFGSVSGIFGSN
ncbi:hypothetical protein [Rhodococcus sp. IEGM 1379]|uniref:hypothetical protein n=1 Tax=Rhodococcus sp. IEGM 1379 TaxID=3047086 RepID=UPI0024B7D569|nr:hypothetical protein [Rhodococcus sp. IEGM 1379]MDI9917587.1 hypothetical protein [Rhodococcus sp. IEGM 1379]